MYYESAFMNKTKKVKTGLSGYEWVMTTLSNPTACHDMFRMSRERFWRLHDVLVSSYGLNSSKRMSSIESLAMFLWIIGAPQSLRQAENRFERSIETVSRKFEQVLDSVFRLSADVIKPRDPHFRIVHPRLRNPRFSPHFDNCIGAIDGTHVPVVVPSSKVLQHVGRHGYSSQNVLAVCDFDMRFTFAVAGWPGSVHDMRVFNDAINKYGDKFPHPPQGKFYLVDSGYPNRPGYLAPYKGTKYHLPEFQQGPRPRGKKEVFNYLHSSLRNVIERSFGVLKMKWRMLLDLPSYPLNKQSKIILASMALHNFIRESNMRDQDFDMCDQDEEYMPMPTTAASQASGATNLLGDEDIDMNAFRDAIAKLCERVFVLTNIM
ncbi:protein ALP1-like [Setaria viridis]|uniref:protein ALP1-like n=1 Tax=Setaria viridis TaxID=4556 RepID=UPI003B3A5B79